MCSHRAVRSNPRRASSSIAFHSVRALRPLQSASDSECVRARPCLSARAAVRPAGNAATPDRAAVQSRGGGGACRASAHLRPQARARDRLDRGGELDKTSEPTIQFRCQRSAPRSIPGVRARPAPVGSRAGVPRSPSHVPTASRNRASACVAARARPVPACGGGRGPPPRGSERSPCQSAIKARRRRRRTGRSCRLTDTGTARSRRAAPAPCRSVHCCPRTYAPTLTRSSLSRSVASHSRTHAGLRAMLQRRHVRHGAADALQHVDGGVVVARRQVARQHDVAVENGRGRRRRPARCDRRLRRAPCRTP